MNARADAKCCGTTITAGSPRPAAAYRLLEEPKPRLKRIQRWLLDNVLAPIPPSDVAHRFVAGHSVRTFVAPHVGRTVVVRMDLADFFASISRAHIAAIFRRVGYPSRVAAALAGLCTAPTPDRVLAQHPRAGHRSRAKVLDERSAARRAPAARRTDVARALEPGGVAARSPARGTRGGFRRGDEPLRGRPRVLG